jgi:cytosine/uracil/thiamine/allantoin permease
MKYQNKSLWQQLLIIPVIVLIFCTISTAPAQTAPQIAEKTLAATVYLEMQDT